MCVCVYSNFIDELQEESISSFNDQCESTTPTLANDSPSRVIDHLQVQRIESELSEKQKATLVNLKEAYGFSTKLILQAFKECSNSHLEEAIKKWCIEHVQEYNSYLSDEENEHIDSYSESSDAELEVKVTIDEVLSFGKSLETPSNFQQEPVEVEQKLMPPEIGIGEQMSINKYHPFVKELMDAGYPLEHCVSAVKKHPDNIHKAMDYISLLEDSEEDEEVIQDPINEDEPEENRKNSTEHSNKVDHR